MAPKVEPMVSELLPVPRPVLKTQVPEPVDMSAPTVPAPLELVIRELAVTVIDRSVKPST